MKKYHHILYILLLTHLAACIDEDTATPRPGKETLLEWKLDVSEATPVDTRAAQKAREEAIASATALVFDKDDTFAYIAASTVDASAQTIGVKMRLSASAADQYSVMFVANASAAEAALQGKTKAEVRQALTFASPGKWDAAATPIPMWGETEKFQVVVGFTTAPVPMTRALARIDVGLNFTSATNGAETAGGLSADGKPYTLESVTLYRTRTAGYVIPPASGTATPHIPADAPTYEEPMTYGPPSEVSGNLCVGQIYAAENTADGAEAGKHTMLVAGISLDGETTYYPIELRATNDNSARLPLLRNHRYIINITDITGKGYADEAAALAGKPRNAQWTLQTESLTQTTIVNGGHWLQLETTTPMLRGKAGSSTAVKWRTTCPSFGAADFAWANGSSSTFTYTVTEDAASPNAQGERFGTITFTAPNTNTGTGVITETLNGHCSSVGDFSIHPTQDIGRVQFDIENVVVHGIYLPKITLGGVEKTYPLIAANHYMTLELKTNKADALNTTASTYTLTCNAPVNGYTFQSVTGSFASTSYRDSGSFRYFSVTLTASGTPVAGGYNYFGLTSDGEALDDSGTKTVKENIRVLCGYHQKIMLGASYYQNEYGYSTQRGGSNTFMSSAANIGLSGTIPVESVERSWAKNVGDAPSDLIAKLNAASPKPDIVIIGFYAEFTAAQGQVLTDYVNNGGVVIMQCEPSDEDNVANVVNKVTGLSLGSSHGSGSGTTYPLAASAGTGQTPAADDPIMAGPYGNLFGKRWGEDASITLGVSGLTSTGAVVYSRQSSGYASGNVTMFRWKTKGFFFVGDGGFISQAKQTAGTSSIEPFWIDGSGRPITNTKYSPAVDNSKIFANVMYWAIDYAEFKGINKKTESKSYADWGK